MLDKIADKSAPTAPIPDDVAFDILRTVGRELKARFIWNSNVYMGNDDVYMPEKEKWHRDANMCMFYMLDNFDDDQCIAAFKVMMQDFVLPFDSGMMDCFTAFSTKFKELMLERDGFGRLGLPWAAAAEGWSEVVKTD